MQSLTIILKRKLYFVAAVMLTAAVTLPNILVGHASAALLTSRYIEMETSTPSASGQQYEIGFTIATAATDISSIVVDFCAESPLIGDSNCTLPTGMTIGTTVSAETLPANWTADIQNTHELHLTSDAPADVSATGYTLTIDGFTNSSTEGTFYARILTYDSDADGDGYTSDDPDAVGAHIDDGGVALSTVEKIDISAAVLETLTFCTSAAVPGDDCSPIDSPDLTLGSGSPAALSTSAVDTGTLYFQLSSNATNTTTVRLAGDTLESGSNNIDAAGGTASAIVAGTEEFGLRLGTESGVGTNSGTITKVAPYDDATNYGFDTTATTSVYGDIIATSAGGIANRNMQLIFAATIGNATVAGNYTTELSLIATSVY
jgi:hypothetical protein